MNKNFTLSMVGLLCLATSLKAQISQTFEGLTNLTSLQSNCWSFSGMNLSTGSQITGTNSLYIIPTTSNGNNVTSNTGKLMTPFIDLQSGNVITFKYEINNDLSTQANRLITVSLLDKNGNTTPLSSVSLTRNNPDRIETRTYSHTLAMATPGTQRIVVDISGNGDGNTYLFFDDIAVNKASTATIQPQFHYSPTNCNSAPDAVNDTYTSSTSLTPVNGNLLLNDTDPNTVSPYFEKISIASLTQPSTGVVTYTTDGEFTFTPNASFTGGPVTFTYTLTDDGYSPLTDAATVTITYPAAPEAVADTYAGSFDLAPYSGDVLPNDSKPTGTVLTATVVDKPAAGTVVLNPDGTFTYTPATGFTGGDVTFSYRVTYEAYAPLYSNTAVVTISYPAQAAPLPIKLVSFNGSLQQSDVVLQWSVDDNHTGEYFEVQKSVDGKTFTNAAMIFVSAKTGREVYTYNEKANAAIYYRLRIVNKDRSIAYSKVILVKAQDNTSASTISLLQNPVQSAIRFKFNAATAGENVISVYGINGVRVMVQKLAVQKGMNYVELDASALPKGTYVLEVASLTEQRRIKLSK